MHCSLIVKSQQNRTELVTRPGPAYSVESSPSRKSLRESSNYHTGQQQHHQQNRTAIPAGMNSSGGRKRSESLPPPNAGSGGRGTNRGTGSLLPSLSSLLNPPEPSRTYSPELSVLKNGRGSGGHGHQGPRCFPEKIHPFSASLENLDPSAKEFLVDAGVLLESIKAPKFTSAFSPFTSAISSATSMPNLPTVQTSSSQVLPL